MTSHRVRDDLSFCLVDERPIFLDMSRDRYFRLSGKLERVFMLWLAHRTSREKDITLLVDRGILTDTPPSVVGPREPAKEPQISLLELPVSPATCRIRTVLEVFAVVCLTQLQLKTIGMKATVGRALASSNGPAATNVGLDLPRLSSVALSFLEARRLLPLDTCCLLDSLAMARFLRRRRMKVHVVIGVTSEPFTAHCWVQAADIVLNDSIGNVRTYSPIRVL